MIEIWLSIFERCCIFIETTFNSPTLVFEDRFEWRLTREKAERDFERRASNILSRSASNVGDNLDKNFCEAGKEIMEEGVSLTNTRLASHKFCNPTDDIYTVWVKSLTNLMSHEPPRVPPRLLRCDNLALLNLSLKDVYD